MKDALLSTVIDEYSTVEAFASVLALEEKALTAVEPLETLPPIVEKKTELVGKLSTLEQLRDAQLAELGYPAGWPGMELAADGDARLAAQWSLLQKAAEANLHHGYRTDAAAIIGVALRLATDEAVREKFAALQRAAEK